MNNENTAWENATWKYITAWMVVKAGWEVRERAEGKAGHP